MSSINVLGKLYCSVQFSCSVMSDSTTPCTAPRQASPSIELVMPSNHLIVCRPLLLPPSIFPSVRSFQMSLFFLRWPEYWSFSLSISPSSEHSRLITFRMHRLDLPAVQGTLKSLLQHHNSKASIFRCSPFFIVQLSHPYQLSQS